MALTISEMIGREESLYKMLLDNLSNNLRVAIPGIIQEFNPVTQTATVQVALREKIQNQDLSQEWVNIPPLLDVPIVLPRAGGFVLTMPVQKGDECLVIFADMCIDAWFSNGNVQNQLEKRRHDLSDGIAIVGMWSQPNVIPNYSTTSAQFRSVDGLTSISLSPGTIDLNAKNVKTNGTSLSSSSGTSSTDMGIDVKADYGAKGDGVTDDTISFQNAINNGGRIIIPSGTYLVGALTIPSNTQIIGIGLVILKHNLSTGFVATGWDRAMITSANQPVYTDPSLPGAQRTNAQGVVSNITIENITLDGGNQTVKGLQLIAADSVNVRNVTVQNTGKCSVDLVAIRWSRFNINVTNCQQDPMSLTDKYFGGKRSFSTDVTFDHCIVQNSGTNPTVDDPVPSPFEVSDGPSNVYFLNCKALNNNGCGFDFHIHISDWDLQNINCINCQSIGNNMTTVNTQDVAGFRLGQCPSGSTYKNITFENCISIGSQCAFTNTNGSQSGYKENVKIIGGYWENAYTTDGTLHNNNAVLYVGKYFRSFKIIGADLKGSTDGYGIYTYSIADGLKISNVTIKNVYVPLNLTHSGGRVELEKISIDVINPSSPMSTVFIAVECDDVSVNGIISKLDIAQYTSSIVRFINTKKNSIQGLVIENVGTLGGNCVQFDTVDMATLTGCTIKNFNDAVFLSNTSNSIVSVGNNFKGCTNKYNSTPSYLVDVGNAI
jgi:hypothetical protein